MSKIQFRNAAHRDFVLENLDKCKVNEMCIRDSRGADEKSDCRKNTSPKKDKNKY